MARDHIATREKLKRVLDEATMAVDHWLNRDSPLIIERQTIEEFSNHIRPYIATPDNEIGLRDLGDGSVYNENRGGGGDELLPFQSPWPLVRVCSLYHNWHVLKHGIVLVDLPGLQDANYVRGRVAEEYLEKCHAIYVVADSVHGVDDERTQNLGFRLHDELGRQLQMDGKLHMISFVLTKTDNYQGLELAREADRENGETEWNDLNDKVKEAKREEEEALKDSKKRLPEAVTVQVLRRVTDSIEKKKDAEKAKQRSEMEWLRQRNEGLKQRVKRVYQDQLSEMRAVKKVELDVFCVSAQEYLQLNRFEEKEDTEIPALQAHISEFARKQKTKVAKAVLSLAYKRASLLATVLAGQALRSQITDNVLDPLTRTVRDEVRSWNDRVVKEIRSHSLKTQLERGAEEARNAAIMTQSSWRRLLHWMTYRITMKGQGTFDSPSFGLVDMNRKLADPILSSIQADWETVFEDILLPSVTEDLLGDIESALDAWKENATQASGDATNNENYIEDSIRRYLSSRISLCIETESANWEKEVMEHQRDGWRGIQTRIQKSLSDGYSQAAAEHGAGMFDRMHERMVKELQIHEAMFNVAVGEVKNGLSELVDHIARLAEKALGEESRRIAVESVMNINATNYQQCAALVVELNERAIQIREFGQEVGLQPEEESGRRLEDAVSRMTPHLGPNELADIMERMNLVDSEIQSS